MRKYQQIIGGVVGSVLWLSLGGSAGAHTQTLPTCSSSNLPTAENFFDGAETSVEFESNAWVTSGTIATKRGLGSAVNGGSEKYRYGRINMPSMAAGELRMFAAQPTGHPPSDAILCAGSRTKASYKTSYRTINSNHDGGETAVVNARSAATTARAEAMKEEAIDLDANSDSDDLRRAEDRVRSDLATAADALKAISQALEKAGQGTRGTATDPGDVPADTYRIAEDKARAARVDKEGDNPANDDPTDEITALRDAAIALDAAANALENHLDNDHADQGFKIRTEVNLGEREYILILVQPNPAADLSVNVHFHGALSNDSRTGRINDFGGSVEHLITVTAPGLLTLSTTGRTDTEGTLVGVPDASVKDGGTGGNFKMAVPVTLETEGTPRPLTLRVSEQTGNAAGGYTLDMEFAVAMPPSTTADQVTVTVDPGWGETTITEDDSTVQIARRPQDGNQADRDVFVFTPAQSGLLSINGNDGATGKPSNTAGTLFGPMGQIATSTDSGPGNPHFGFSVPVKANNSYAVQVTGTDGTYRLALDLDTVIGAHINTTSEPTSIFPAQTLEAPTNNERDRNRYLFNIEKPGTLYLQTTGSAVDVQGRLYDPRGVVVARDNIGGTGNLRIVAHVTPGLYLLVVEGTSNAERGDYALSANFAEGVTDPDPTDTGTGTGTGNGDNGDNGDSGTIVDEVEPDPHGILEEPGHDDIRSGVVMVRGWVCQDDGNGVRIEIRDQRRNRLAVPAFIVPYGSPRADVTRAEECDSKRDHGFGFGGTFNLNHLDAGLYNVRAFVGRQQIGWEADDGTFTPDTNLMEVIRISDEEFLEDVESERVRVEDFPEPGTTVILQWHQASQNFQIVDVE